MKKLAVILFVLIMNLSVSFADVINPIRNPGYTAEMHGAWREQQRRYFEYKEFLDNHPLINFTLQFYQDGIISWPITVFIIMSIILVIKKIRKNSVNQMFIISYIIVACLAAMYSVDRCCVITKGYSLGFLSDLIIVLMAIPIIFLIKFIIDKIRKKTTLLNKAQKMLIAVLTVLLVCHVGLRITNSVLLDAKLSKYKTEQNIGEYNEMIDDIKVYTRTYKAKEYSSNTLNYEIWKLEYNNVLSVNVNGDEIVYKTRFFSFDDDYLLSSILNHGLYFVTDKLSDIWNGFIHFYFYSYMW